MNSVVLGILFTSAIILLGNSYIIRAKHSKEKKREEKEKLEKISKRNRKINSLKNTVQEKDEEIDRLNEQISRMIKGKKPRWQK